MNSKARTLLWTAGLSLGISVLWSLVANAVTNGSGLLFIIGMALLISGLFVAGKKSAAWALVGGWLGVAFLSVLLRFSTDTHRFEKTQELGVAFDTKTGQLCKTTPYVQGKLPECKSLATDGGPFTFLPRTSQQQQTKCNQNESDPLLAKLPCGPQKQAVP